MRAVGILLALMLVLAAVGDFNRSSRPIVFCGMVACVLMLGRRVGRL